MKISACIIAKNEAENLPVCLQSLQKIVDEIIVIDTGSTDDTAMLAKAFGAKVYDYIWQDDFAITKNFAIEKAIGDWIIFLDADEYFSPETAKNVRQVVGAHAQECDAYLLKMINIDVDNQNKMVDAFYAVRIFKNCKELRFFGKVHEELRFLDGKRKALYQVDEKDILLYHTGYSKQRIKLKCQRNLKILLEELNKNPENVDLYRYLADAYHGLEDFKNAVKYAKMDIETGKKEISYASRSYRVIYNSLVKMKAEKSEIAYYLLKAIESFPNLPDFYAEYALLKYNSQEYEEAFDLLTKAMKLHENYNEVETSLFINKLPLVYLIFGLLYQRKNNFKDALEYYQKTLTLDKYYPEAFSALFQLIHKQEAVYVISFLNMLYDIQRRDELKFLVDHIGTMQKGKLYQYYCNKLDAVSRNDEKEQYTYEQSRAAMFLTLSLILINQLEKIKQVEAFLPIAYTRIIYRYQGLSDEKLNEEDFATYKNILLELLLTDEKHVLTQYAALCPDFKPERVLEIAQILQEKKYFLQVLNLYEYMLESYQDINLADIYYQMGRCAYQLEEYKRGIEYFKQASNFGYQENDLKEFLAWSVEKS